MEEYTESFALPAGVHSAIAIQSVMQTVARQLMQKAGAGILDTAWCVTVSVAPERADHGQEHAPQSANTDAAPVEGTALFGARPLQAAPPPRDRTALTPEPIADADPEVPA